MYNKLFAKILDSSIWLEPDPVRLVWITLLAAMDQDGYAHFSAVQNLAERARVSLDDCKLALEKLMAPDAESGIQENDGRRVERVPGGFIILNAKHYRDLVSREIQRENTRERVRRFRAKQKTVTDCNDSVTPSEADTEASTSTEADTKRTKIAPDGAKKASVEEEPRPRDILWDALLQACGVPLTAPIPKSARGAYNRALKDLRDIGADPGQIDAHAQQFRLRWPNVTLTPTALVRRWNECVSQNRSLNNAVR